MLAPSSPSLRASIWEWILVVILVANLTWTTLCLGGYRADTLVVTSTLNALLLGLHLVRRACSMNERKLHPAGWLLLPFLIYAAANVHWVTPVPALGWRDWLGWAQLVAVFWVVLNDIRSLATRRFLFAALLALAIVSTALACYQRFARPDWLMLGSKQAEQFLTRSSGPFAVPNSFAATLVLLLPAVLWSTWRRGASAVERVSFGYVAALLLLGLGLTVSRGAWLGLAVALVVWPFLAKRIRWHRRLIFSAGIVLVVAATFSVLYSSVPQARERIGYFMRDAGEKSRPVLWRAAWLIFQEHPAVGSGAASYAALFEKHRPEHEQTDPLWTHNDYLNTLSDYGAVGFLLFFGACGFIAWRCARTSLGASPSVVASMNALDSPGFTTALVVGILAFGLHLVVDFHLKIPALAMWVAAVGGQIVGKRWVQTVDRADDKAVVAERWSYRVAAGSAAAVVVGLQIGWALPVYRSEAVRDEFRQRLNSLAVNRSVSGELPALLAAAHDGFSRAISLDPGNAQAWADRAYVAAVRGHHDPARENELGRAAEVDARRAVALAVAVPEYWLRLGVALDMQGRWNEAGDAFAEAMNRAPVSAVTWFYFAYHLSLNPGTERLARSAVATSLRLDPSRLEAERLRQLLAAPR